MWLGEWLPLPTMLWDLVNRIYVGKKISKTPFRSVLFCFVLGGERERESTGRQAGRQIGRTRNTTSKQASKQPPRPQYQQT